MADILEQPEQFKAELKDKWLDYYETNRNWLQYFMDNNASWFSLVDDEGELGDSEYNPRRPNAYFIIGVVTLLEPQLQSLFVFLPHLQANSNALLQALDLDFDPEIELQKRSQQKFSSLVTTKFPYPETIREEIKT